MKTPLFLVLIMVLLVCKIEAVPGTVPTLITFDVTDIMLTTASCGGTIADEGSGKVLSRGVCWSTGNTATIDR